MKARPDFSGDGDIALNGFVPRFRNACEAVHDDMAAVAVLRVRTLRDDDHTDLSVYIVAEQSEAYTAFETILSTIRPDEALTGGYSVRRP